MPWVHGLEKRFGDKGFRVVGIHSPEYDFEKDRARVMRFAKKFKIVHPIYVDNDLAYWKSLENANWPVFYLVDRSGMIRGKIAGEMHEGTRRAEWFETLLVHLLQEKPSLNGTTPSE
ncbi:MAG: hypothetical protein O7A67_04545 [SAR324 cluster bacterium]|nr:hypothetical protein [SAR324 cluster bacterium]